MIRRIIILFFLFTFISCNQPLDSISKEEKNNLNSFIESGILKINQTDNDFQGVLLYLVLRDCSCVKENIEFVKENLNEGLRKKVTLIIKPDISRRYLNEFKKIQHKISYKVNLFIDYGDTFSKYGNLYVTDKLFIIKNSKVTGKIELKKDNFEVIAKMLFN